MLRIFKNGYGLLALVLLTFVTACTEAPERNAHFNVAALPASDTPAKQLFTEPSGKALPPFGYWDFCQRNPLECPEQMIPGAQNKKPATVKTASVDPRPAFRERKPFFGGYRAPKKRKILSRFEKPAPDILKSKDLAFLKYVNKSVNAAIRPMTDAEGFGKAELWRIPDISAAQGDIGDCEDYALLKRKKLIEAGADFRKLSLAVVRQPSGEIHAVLLATTPQGDMVLDNLTDKVKLWSETPYRWIKRQSVEKPYLWVSLYAHGGMTSSQDKRLKN